MECSVSCRIREVRKRALPRQMRWPRWGCGGWKDEAGAGKAKGEVK